MSIKYAIIRSHLPTHPTGYTGRIQRDKTILFDEVVDRVAHSNTTVSRSDVLSVLEDFMTAVIDMVLDGKSVCTPLAGFRAGIQGLFENAGDGYDLSRHEVVARLRAGPRLRAALRAARMEKVDVDPPRPRPRTYVDVASTTQDSVLTSGGPGRLLGRELQFDPTDSAQGIFVVADGGSATRVETVVLNSAGHLAFIVPTLAAGSYRLQVRAVLNDTAEVRVGELPVVLTVS